MPCSKHKLYAAECSDCKPIQIYDSLPNGKLPNNSEVLGYYMYQQSLVPQMKSNITNVKIPYYEEKNAYLEESGSLIFHLPTLKETAAVFRLKSGGENF